MSKDIPSADDYEELILSARYGDVEDLDAFVMRFGVEKGDPKGQLSQCDERGNTALHMASANGHQGMVEHHLRAHADDSIRIKDRPLAGADGLVIA